MKKKNVIREYVESFAFALIVALLIRAVIIQSYRIPTGSMKDTLLVGDFLLVNKFIYGAKTPDRVILTDIKLPHFRFPAVKQPKKGEIVVFQYPRDPKLNYIKRCVAVAGDTIQVKNNVVFINNKPYESIEFIKKVYDPEDRFEVNYYKVITPSEQEYTIRRYAQYKSRLADFGPVVVPDNHLFMMGDNRDNSSDSRVWGFMPMTNVVGEALVIYWSWDKFPPLWKIGSKVRWERIFGVIR